MLSRKNYVLIWLVLLFVFPILSEKAYAEKASTQVGLVVSEQSLATKVGMDILQHGGNAIDAAVAVGYVLAVVNPCCGNIGGNGFMLIHLANGKNIFINFRSRAPLAATPSMFLDENSNIIPNKSTDTYASVAVPGTVLGLENALSKYGALTRQQVMTPAIKLAEMGYKLSDGDAKLISSHVALLSKSPNVAKIFFKKNKNCVGWGRERRGELNDTSRTLVGTPEKAGLCLPYKDSFYKPGDVFVQKDLAKTLSLISHYGSSVFYRGKIAAEVVEASQKNNGILSLKDFEKYTTQELKPITCHYHGYTIYSAPPPSSGGTTLCEILNIIKPYPITKMGYHSADATHYLVEAMRYAFYDRNKELGDPDFVNNPIAKLISLHHAENIRKNINPNKATSSHLLTSEINTNENMHTTHYSIVDKQGNAVAVTYTLNSLFGSGLIAGNTGFLLNNDMDDFTAKPGVPNQFSLVMGEKNKIEPGKRPLSAMAPTIIMKDDKLVMVLGSPGGPRIITSVLQTIINVLDYGMTVQQAIDAPRFHHQWLPDVIYAEPNAFSSDVVSQLKQMGYQIITQKPWGAVEAIYLNPKTYQFEAGADKRRIS